MKQIETTTRPNKNVAAFTVTSDKRTTVFVLVSNESGTAGEKECFVSMEAQELGQKHQKNRKSDHQFVSSLVHLASRKIYYVQHLGHPIMLLPGEPHSLEPMVHLKSRHILEDKIYHLYYILLYISACIK